MTDIMELIRQYGFACMGSIVNNVDQRKADELWRNIVDIIPAMQEVCDIAIKYKGLGMSPDLYDAVTKLEGLK